MLKVVGGTTLHSGKDLAVSPDMLPYRLPPPLLYLNIKVVGGRHISAPTSLLAPRPPLCIAGETGVTCYLATPPLYIVGVNVRTFLAVAQSSNMNIHN